MKFTKEIIDKELDNISDDAYTECCQTLYSVIADSVDKKIEMYQHYLDTFNSSTSDIEFALQAIADELSLHGDFYSALTNEQFMFPDKVNSQMEKYTFQLNALNYCHDIYIKYQFVKMGENLSEYSDITMSVLTDLNIFYYVIINKFAVSTQCLNELAEAVPSVAREQWNNISTSGICIKLSYTNAISVNNILTKFGAKPLLCNYLLIGLSKYSTLNLDLPSDYKEQSENVKTNQIGTINNRIIDKGCEIKNQINKKHDVNDKRIRKTIALLFMGAWIALLGLSHYLGSNYLSEMITSSYYFMTIFFSCLVDFLIIGIPGFAILKKWETKHKKLESYVDQCLSDRINKTIEKVETEGVFSISDDMRKHLINCLDPLKKKYTDLFNNKGMPITKKYTQLASKVTASTKFLPKNVLEQTVLLDLATKQMRTGMANDYQTAIFQAQQIHKQDTIEAERRAREYQKEQAEKAYRDEVLESQKRAEE